MAYSDFNAHDLTTKLGVKFEAENLFPNVQAIKPSMWLIEALYRGKKMGINNAKSRSERLVNPILLELANHNYHLFSVYSGFRLDVDENLGLCGECDFMFSLSKIHDLMNSPIFCIIASQKQDTEQSTIQCATQLIGARRFNEMEKNNISAIYGCATTGIEWRFIRYEWSSIFIDEKRYLINELPQLLGVFQSIIDTKRKQIKNEI